MNSIVIKWRLAIPNDQVSRRQCCRMALSALRMCTKSGGRSNGRDSVGAGADVADATGIAGADEEADAVDEDADAVDEEADAVDEDADAVDEDADAVDEDADAADEDGEDEDEESEDGGDTDTRDAASTWRGAEDDEGADGGVTWA